jgi:hypothetical protein
VRCRRFDGFSRVFPTGFQNAAYLPDYPAIEGVRRAMDEFFFAEDDASLLPLSGQQALAVKI